MKNYSSQDGYAIVLFDHKNWQLIVNCFASMNKWETNNRADVMHDHQSWRGILSIGLWGKYLEHTIKGCRIWHAPWIRWIPSKLRHKITRINEGKCWTLLLMVPKSR